MSTFIKPEFGLINEEVDIKPEPFETPDELPNEPLLRIDIFDEDYEDGSDQFSCPVCRSEFKFLPEIENHLYFEHCRSVEAPEVNSLGQFPTISVTYPCLMPSCPFSSPLSSALLLHYFGHIDDIEIGREPILSNLNTGGLPESMWKNPARTLRFLSKRLPTMNPVPLNSMELIKALQNARKDLKVKAKSKKDQFSCIEPGCLYIFNSVRDLQIHNINDHQLKGDTVVNPVRFWRCPCGHVTLTKLHMDKHMKKFHGGDPTFPQPTCSTSLKNTCGRKPKFENPSKEGDGLNRFFELIKGSDFKDFWQCLQPGCDARFPKEVDLKAHTIEVHGMPLQRKYKYGMKGDRHRGIVSRCKRRGVYKCILCGWMGALIPWVHLKSVHEKEYTEFMADGTPKNLHRRPITKDASGAIIPGTILL